MTQRERSCRVKEAFKLLEGVTFGPVFDDLAQLSLDSVATLAFHEGIATKSILLRVERKLKAHQSDG